VAVANQKGGVGKTTTTVSLAGCLSERGLRILVVDLDPQGNASTGLGIDADRRLVTTYELLTGAAPLARATVVSPARGVRVVPATIDLAGAEVELATQLARESRLSRALTRSVDDVDVVLLDCPPSLGLLTVNALAAAEELLVPIQCEYYALEGLGLLLSNATLIRENVNPGLAVTGILLTMFDPRIRLAEQVVADVRAHFGTLVFETVIPRAVRLAEAPGFGVPITLYDPGSRASEAYRALAGEFLARGAAAPAASWTGARWRGADRPMAEGGMDPATAPSSVSTGMGGSE
jgi:chromosome partitioning protein